MCARILWTEPIASRSRLSLPDSNVQAEGDWDPSLYLTLLGDVCPCGRELPPGTPYFRLASDFIKGVRQDQMIAVCNLHSICDSVARWHPGTRAAGRLGPAIGPTRPEPQGHPYPSHPL
jgi:hypothetical protein